MKLKAYVCGGCEGMIFDDDVTDEEIVEAAKLLALTEPGNGSGRIFYRKIGTEYDKEENKKKRT